MRAHKPKQKNSSCISKAAKVGLASVMLLICGCPAYADVFSDLVKVVGDPLRLESTSARIQDTVLESLAQIDQIRARSNKDAEDRLNQLREVVDSAIKGGSAFEQQAFADMQTLNKQIFADAAKLLFEAECAAVRTANGTFQDAIVNGLSNIAKAQPRIKIFGIPIVEYSSKQTILPEPNAFYFATKSESISKLRASLESNEQTNAYDIILTYSFLERLAKNTKCYYLNSVEKRRFAHEQIYWFLQQQAWESAVDIKSPN